MSCLLRDNILKFDRPVPRYTSYPAAPHFQKSENTKQHKQWLASLPDHTSLSLYLHIPFCAKLCWYCGCHTKITQRYAPVENYIHLLIREAKHLSDHITKNHHVKHIHFGGGSPGLISGPDFEKIMGQLHQCFTIDQSAEIAMEIDPRNVDEERVKRYAKMGINRISLGVQDFNEKVLESVNRPQPYELSKEAIRLFRKHGINQFNFDLIYGLPHQNTENMKQTIDKALSLSPDRISLFGYAHVPWMKKHMRLIDEKALPDKSLRFDLFEAGAKQLKKAGYVQIGIDHFAKAKDPLTIAATNKKLRRNFQGYTTDQCDALLGLGASSISKFPQGYIQNAVDLPIYKESVLNGNLTSKKQCLITKGDIIHADVVEQIMCHMEVNLQTIIKKYNLPNDYFSIEFENLSSYINEGIVSIEDHMFLKINPNATAMTRLVAACFDQYFNTKPKEKKHAQAI